MKHYYDNENFFTAYSRMSRSQKGLSGAGEWEQLQSLFPDLREKTILDLGCGYGWHCNYASEQGAAEVLGIDLSEKMIAEAQKRHSRKNIRYEVGSITDYAYPPETFDLVFSNLALHYIADLDDIYAKVWQTLKPGGVFLFNMEHPTFTAGVRQEWVRNEAGEAKYWPVDDYFYPGERETVFLGEAITKEHHTLTQILMGLLKIGFRLTAVEEVMPPERWREAMPDEMRRPMMLLVRAEKEEMQR